MINMEQSKHSLYKWESGGNDEAPDLDSIRDEGSHSVLGFSFFALLTMWTLSVNVF